MEKVIITGNEPASGIPRSHTEFNDLPPEAVGLTIRQQFAAMAMQGLMTDFNNYGGHDLTVCEKIALKSVRMADALIEALNK